MKALITGASSGIGRDMARYLSQIGYDIVAVARREDRLIELKNELKTNVEIMCLDISKKEDCMKLEDIASEIDIFINNAGFGVFGKFWEGSLSEELNLIETNVKGLHTLTKIFVKAFKEKNSGKILNVASLAAFFPGPLFSTYYASKAYVLRLSQGIMEELKKEKSNVKISVLCPGPVNTEFGDVAKVNFGDNDKGIRKMVILNSDYVAKYAIDKMLKGKEVIVPGFIMKCAVFMRHLLPDKILSKIIYIIQSKKFTK